MRIAWITNNYTPYISGVTQSLLAMTPFLWSLGHTVGVITLDFLDSYHPADPPWVMRVPSVLKFKYRGNHMAIAWRSAARVADFLQDFAPDIIHSHHPFLLGMVALRCARVMRKPIVFTHHTLYQAYAHHIPLPQSLVCFAINTRVGLYCRSVDRIIAPSDPIARMLERYAIPDKITVLPSGIRPVFIADDHATVQQEYFNLLVVGRFSPEKNLFAVIDAYTHLKKTRGYRLVFAGYGAQLQCLQNYAYKHYDLAPQEVVFIVHPSENQLVELYRTAHLFLFSSTTDTQGLVLAESMASGVPVIALHGPGQSAIIVDGSNGFLVDTVQHMAERIEYCFEHRVVYDSLRYQAWLTGQRYDPRFVARDLARVYEDLVR